MFIELGLFIILLLVFVVFIFIFVWIRWDCFIGLYEMNDLLGWDGDMKVGGNGWFFWVGILDITWLGFWFDVVCVCDNVDGLNYVTIYCLLPYKIGIDWSFCTIDWGFDELTLNPRFIVVGIILFGATFFYTGFWAVIIFVCDPSTSNLLILTLTGFEYPINALFLP